MVAVAIADQVGAALVPAGPPAANEKGTPTWLTSSSSLTVVAFFGLCVLYVRGLDRLVRVAPTSPTAGEAPVTADN